MTDGRPGPWHGPGTPGAGWGGLLDPRANDPPTGQVTTCSVHHMPETVKPSRTPAATSQRLKLRRDLAAAAMELFATKGYEGTTVDEIAARAGVARRTFFRHFRSKEEAIFPDHDETLVRAQAVLEAAPAHEHPLDTVCRGIKEVMRMYASSPRASVERYKLTREVPALREREIASVARYERLFTRYLLGHFDEAAHGDGVSDFDEPLLAEVAASAVVSAHNHVLRRWLRGGAVGDVEAQLDHAFAIVRETFGTGFGANQAAHGGRSRAAETERRGEVLVTVARTDAPLADIMSSIQEALRKH
ncbi:TetR family transcriptional regulator [Streptomyces sp. Z26]|nr:TetR family transcriptional regulator [Streptomyces sp. Z26]